MFSPRLSLFLKLVGVVYCLTVSPSAACWLLSPPLMLLWSLVSTCRNLCNVVIRIQKHDLNFSSLHLSCCVLGFGVKKISTVNLKANHYVPIHIKQIRGLAFNRQQDGLLLSAAFDNTIKLTRYETHFLILIGQMALRIRAVQYCACMLCLSEHLFTI